MQPRSTARWAAARQGAPGVVATLGAVGLVELLQPTSIFIPSLAPVLLGVVLTAYLAGVRAALVSAIILAAYAGYYFGAPFVLADVEFRRALSVAAVGFATAFAVGGLRNRAERAHEQTLAAVEETNLISKRQAVALREVNTSLRESNAALETFSYTVAHDLRAPLRAIHTLADHALRDEEARLLSDVTRENFRVMRESALRMSALVGNLLSLARSVSQREFTLEEVDACALARVVAGDVAARHVHRVHFVCEDSAVIICNPPLLNVVLENLLDNAWKYSGCVVDPRVEFCIEDEGRTFVVRDNGAGFDAAKARDLFTPFARYHDARDYPGNGVGLATVRRIVERHGGSVWAESLPGEGAVFRFTLAPRATHSPVAVR